MTTFQKILSLLSASQRRSVVILLAIMLVGTLLETLSIGLVIPAIAVLMQNDLAAQYPRFASLLKILGSPSQPQLVTVAMLVLVLIYLAKTLFMTFLAWRQNKIAADVQMQLSQRLFTIYLRQPYVFHLRRNSVQLLRTCYSEVGAFAEAVYQTILLVTEVMVLLSLAILLFIVEPFGTLIAMMVLGPTGWAFQWSTRDRIRRWGLLRQHHERRRIQHLQQGLSAVKDVKLLGREADFLLQYLDDSTQSARVGQRQSTLQQISRLWLELIAMAGLAALVLTMLAQGRAMASFAPTLGLFAAAAFRFLPSVNRILNSIQSLRYRLPEIDTLCEELELSVPAPVAIVKHSQEFQKEIRLSNIFFTYPGATTPALDGLSLSIRKGGSVGFIGVSGSGKSTLIDIILGLLTPHEGQVLVDGQDIQRNLRVWQDQVGYVPQSIYLTDDTIRRNVAFGLPSDEIDEVAIARAIKAAQLEEFVAKLSNGLETVVGERGIRLSGGQRQRIGIARALYHDPTLLVLDEATSALDHETERGVMEAVNALHGKKTTLIVSHRLSTVEHCDLIVELSGGKVVQKSIQTMRLSELVENDA